MSDLAEWLLARVAEDEALALAVEENVGGWRAGESYDDDSGIADRDAFPSYPWGQRDAELDYEAGPAHPRRVLAECDAKRRIVESVEPPFMHADVEDGWMAHADLTLKLLALPYADRPGYREEWRPTPD